MRSFRSASAIASSSGLQDKARQPGCLCLHSRAGVPRNVYAREDASQLEGEECNGLGLSVTNPTKCVKNNGTCMDYISKRYISVYI